MYRLYPSSAVNSAAGDVNVVYIVMVFVCLALLAALLFRNSVLSRQREMLRASEAALRINEEQYKVAMRHSQLHVFRYDVNNSMAYVDSNLCAKYMLPSELTCIPDSLILAGMLPRQSIEPFTDFFDMMRRGESAGECIVMINDPDKPKQEVWYRFEYTLVENETSRFAVIIYDDYTDKREKLLSNKRLEHEIEMLDLKQVQVLEYNLTLDRCVTVRGTLLEMDMSGDTPLNRRTEHWAKRNLFREDVPGYISFMNRDRLLTAFGDGVREQALDFRVYPKADGEFRWMRLNAQMQSYPDSDEVILYAVYRDIHESKVEELALRALSEEDPLTGVYNRMTFERTVRAILESGEHIYHALLMIDMDGFKNVNDTFGHAVGDKVLINAAQSVRSMLRGGDVVGRIGGDEFMVLLRDIPGEAVVKKRSRLINEILHSRIGDDVTVSASIGVAIFPRDGASFESLYYSADMAVYYAKRHGRDKFCFYSAAMKEEASPIKPTPIERLTPLGDMGDVAKKQVEQILKENETLIARQEEDERYRIVIEGLGVATFEWNIVTRQFSTSALFNQFAISEREPGEIFSRDFDFAGVHPDDTDAFGSAFFIGADMKDGVRKADVRLALRGGEYAVCRVVLIVVGDEMGRPMRLVGAISRRED